MRRREFIALLGGAAAAAPLAARAQPTMPVIGFLHSGSPDANANRVARFRKGLSDAGFVEGRNVAIEFRWALGQYDRLPEMAADLVRRHVAVIATLSSSRATVVAKAATSTIPIFFLTADNPVELGLVASLSRPGGNMTGIASQNVELVEKRLGLLHEIAPQSAVTALVNPSNANGEMIAKILKATARTLGFELHVLEASTDAEIELAYRALVSGSALLIATDPFFFSRRALLIALSARHAVPTIYDNKEFADGGGLMSYGTDIGSNWELAGLYVSRILKGEKPADIPVMQPTKFDFVLNLKTAKTLGLAVPSTLLATADEVIE